MMTIKDLREILIHFQDNEYDDYEVVLWDYNHQQKLQWGGMHGLSHPNKELTFPVNVTPVDGVTIDERIKKLMGNAEMTTKKNRKRQKKTIKA